MRSASFFFMLCSVQYLAATSKPVAWQCDVVDPTWPWPKKSQVFISLSEPTLKRTDYIREDDGTYDEHHDEFITTTTVSSYRAEKKNCTINGAFTDDRYDFSFVCKGIEGGFVINFSKRTGAYTQRLSEMHAKRSFSFENCRATPPKVPN